MMQAVVNLRTAGENTEKSPRSSENTESSPWLLERAAK
jgi:hypothetical protein